MIAVMWIIMYVLTDSELELLSGTVSASTSDHHDQFLTLMKCYNVKRNPLSGIHTSVALFTDHRYAVVM